MPPVNKTQCQFCRNQEPILTERLSDTILRQMMICDGVSMSELLRLICVAQGRLQ